MYLTKENLQKGEDMKTAEKYHLLILGEVEVSLNLVISLLDSKEISRKKVKQLLESLRLDIRGVRQELQRDYTTTGKQVD